MSDLLPDAARFWHVSGWTMIHFLWMGTALWLILVLLRRAMRRSSPQVRYAAALLALGGCALLACGLVVRIGTNGGLLNVARTAYAGDVPVPDASPTADAKPLELAELYRLLAEPPVDATAPDSPDKPGALMPSLHAAAGWLPWVWLCGTPLIAALFGTGLIGTVRLRLHSRTAPEAGVHAMLARLQQALRITRQVTLTVSDQVASPIVIGVLRPMIVLPPAMLTGLAPGQIEMVLLHELAHVRRWDNLFNLLQRVIEAALFYHPAVWWTSRWVRLEREHCCDAVVLAQGRDPQAYAETLASLALPELSPQYAVAAMANHQLVSRIRHILNVEEQGMRLTRSPLAWSGVLLLAAVAALTFNHLAGAQEQSGSPRQPDGPPAAPNAYADAIDSYYFDLLLSQVESEKPADPERTPEIHSLDITLPYPVVDLAHSITMETPAWSALQATGAPNVEEGGDNPHAWAPLTEDGQPEWLELEWQAPVRAAAIMVYESFNPGALVRVKVNGDDIQETTIFDGADPVHVSEGKGVAIIPVTVDSPIKYVRLEFDSPAVPGWNEVDAVGLVALVSGEVHWAVGAQASSTFADRTRTDHADGLLSLEVVRRENSDRIAAMCTHCHQDPHAQNVAPQECPELVRSLLLLRGDRRQRIETLRQELQRLEQEEAVEQQQSVLRNFQELLERRAVEQSEQANSNRIQEYEEAYRHQLRAAQEAERAQAAEQEAMRLRELLKLQYAEAAGVAAPVQEDEFSDWQNCWNAEGARLLAELRRRYEARNHGIDFVDPKAVQGDAVVGSQQLLEELMRSVQQQQQSIDRLAEILEALRMQLRPADPNRSEQPDPEGSGTGNPGDEGSSGEDTSGASSYVDEAALSKFEDDPTFLRRVFLDLQGLPPTPDEVREFETDPGEYRRQLLEKLKEYNLRKALEAPVEPDPSST